MNTHTSSDAAINKAKELVGRYRNEVYNKIGGMTDAAAKQCALIAVDEIIESHIILNDKNYWARVKNEINKL